MVPLCICRSRRFCAARLTRLGRLGRPPPPRSPRRRWRPRRARRRRDRCGRWRRSRDGTFQCRWNWNVREGRGVAGAAPKALAPAAARAVAEPGLADDDDGRAPEGRVDVAGGVGRARAPGVGRVHHGIGPARGRVESAGDRAGRSGGSRAERVGRDGRKRLGTRARSDGSNGSNGGRDAVDAGRSGTGHRRRGTLGDGARWEGKLAGRIVPPARASPGVPPSREKRRWSRG